MRSSMRYLCLCLLFLSGCSSMPDYPSSPNYDVEKRVFVHPEGNRHDKNFGDVMGLMWKFMSRPTDPAQISGFPLMTPADNGAPTSDTHVTWIGHATLLFERRGRRVLTDPMFSERASPFTFTGPKRVVPPAIAIADLPQIDAVIISHSHYDHLDLPGIKKLIAKQPELQFIVPLGLAPMLADSGVKNVTEIDWWQTHQVDDIAITSTPVVHWSSRSMFDRNKTQWAGFMVRFADGYQFYFAGDTGYGSDFIRLRERLGVPDFAAIPIGAYEPRDFMKTSHVNPEEAVQIFADLQVPKAVGIHWGTFKLTLEPLVEPPRRLLKALQLAKIPPERFRALTHGERWDL